MSPVGAYYLQCVHCGWEKPVEKDHCIDEVCPECQGPKLILTQEVEIEYLTREQCYKEVNEILKSFSKQYDGQQYVEYSEFKKELKNWRNNEKKEEQSGDSEVKA